MEKRDQNGSGGQDQDWEYGLAVERLSSFPTDEKQIAPTRLANALRALETYGASRFNLDSQTLWTELCSIAPKSLTSELDLAQSFVDFFVAALYLSFGFAVLSLILVILNEQRGSFDWLAIALPLGTAIVCYKMAVVGCAKWNAAVQALVNLGRKPLAESLGLELPATLAKEKEMWSLVVGFVTYGDDSGNELDQFRAKPQAVNAAVRQPDDAE